MTTEKVQQNKERFIQICREHIHRDGIDRLLDYLETTDFYIAPSSTLFHLNVDGGLCQHSLNVYDAAMKIYEDIVRPAIQAGTSEFTEEIHTESIAIATLFHDLCKTKLYHKSERWRKDERGRWESYMGYEVKDEFPFGHGEKSCIIIGWFLKMKQEELLAIRWHMGMFEMTETGSSTKKAYMNAMEKSPLVSLLQVSDMIASNTMEKVYSM